MIVLDEQPALYPRGSDSEASAQNPSNGARLLRRVFTCHYGHRTMHPTAELASSSIASVCQNTYVLLCMSAIAISKMKKNGIISCMRQESMNEAHELAAVLGIKACGP